MGEAADPCERFPGNRENPRGISQTNFPNVPNRFFAPFKRRELALIFDSIASAEARELAAPRQRETRLNTPPIVYSSDVFPGSRATRPRRGFQAVVVENNPFAQTGFEIFSPDRPASNFPLVILTLPGKSSTIRNLALCPGFPLNLSASLIV